VIRVVPANEASWDEVCAVLGDRGDAARCQCQWFKIPQRDWRDVPVDERAHRLRVSTECDDTDAPATSGLVAYVDDEPAGWCAVEPRSAFVRLRDMRVPWSGRDENPDDDGVWAVTCFVTRAGYRRLGVMDALALATVEHARARGARAVEGYPMATRPGVDIPWGELHVGARSSFEAAGFREVTHPTSRRFVMRIDF
jgi:GNAT superfamily N-acetyltransferase